MDKSFIKQEIVTEDVVWYDAREFALYGLMPAGKPMTVSIPTIWAFTA